MKQSDLLNLPRYTRGLLPGQRTGLLTPGTAGVEPVRTGSLRQSECVGGTAHHLPDGHLPARNR